jgi:hypothetical protein
MPSPTLENLQGCLRISSASIALLSCLNKHKLFKKKKEEKKKKGTLFYFLIAFVIYYFLSSIPPLFLPYLLCSYGG